MIELRDLCKHYRVTRGGWWSRSRALLRAVDGVSFAVGQGESVGLVGESGSGKSTIGQLVQHATQAPSAYNAQNWRFIAVRSAAQKARLCEMAYGQPKVRDAAVTFIVCGNLHPHIGLRQRL